MTPCGVQASGTDFYSSGKIELYFYGELIPAERDACERHLAACELCRGALDELATIRDALAARPAVSAPPNGDWSAFMARLDRAIEEDGEQAAGRPAIAAPPAPRAAFGRRPYAGYLAMAALLALVTMSVVFAMRSRNAGPERANGTTQVEGAARPIGADAAGQRQAFAALSEEHFERSKLVVLGLATMDAEHATSRDWTYERELASTLLADTRMYRMAAEDRGLQSLAGVMSDLEVVLLQTSLTDETDPASLAQIQRLIHKRDLLEKMEVVNHVGLGP
jgi:hypothetical protein